MFSKALSWLFIGMLIGFIHPIDALAQTDQVSGEKIVSVEAQKPSEQTKLIAYFFHGRKQCISCRTIEAYAHDAIKTNFAAQLSDGKIEWAKVNYDNPEFSHFKKEFELYTQSVVIVEMQGDEIVRWKNLKDVWTLIRDKEKFYDYIRTEVQPYLTAK